MKLREVLLDLLALIALALMTIVGTSWAFAGQR
jgi:hypothetical protein